jgi:hypothetical protein
MTLSNDLATYAAVETAARHYDEAAGLGDQAQSAPVALRPLLVARAQLAATQAVADELRALRLTLGAGR